MKIIFMGTPDIAVPALEKIIEVWFRGVKDLLDDGKVNDSQ